MDPGLAITIVETSWQLGKELYNIVQTVRHAPEDIQDHLRRLTELYMIVTEVTGDLKDPRIRKLVEGDATVKANLTRMVEPTLRLVKRMRPLMTDIKALREDDSQASKTKFTLNGLKWFWLKKDVLEAQTDLDNTIQTVQLALLTSNLVVNLRSLAIVSLSPPVSGGDGGRTPPPLSASNIEAELERLERQGQQLRKAARDGNVTVITLLIDSGVPVDGKDEEGRTALSHASETGRTDTVRLLLARGGSPNATAEKLEGSRDKVHESFRTPLHWAAHCGHTEVATLLIDAKARLEARAEAQRTPAQQAASSGHVDVVKVLLDRGADANSTTSQGWTMLHTAARRSMPDLVQVLLDHGADVHAVYRAKSEYNEQNDHAKGTTPLHWAVYPTPGTGSKPNVVAVVRLLLENGKAEVARQDSARNTALHYAVTYKVYEAIDLLLSHADRSVVNMADNEGRTALHIAARKNEIEVVGKLLKNRADPNITDYRGSVGRTALLEAAERGYTDIVRKLHKKGARLDAVSSQGWTALHLAAEEDRRDVVKYLVEHGACVTAKIASGNRAGKTAKDIAKARSLRYLQDLEKRSDGEPVK